MSYKIDLSGRVALVTGGSRGIGAACVRLLAAAGAHVAFSYRQAESEALALVAEIESVGHRVEAIQADLSDPRTADDFMDCVESVVGAVDILVANAGIWEHSPLADLNLETLRRTLSVNVESLILTSRRAALGMAERGWGRIVMIGSTAGQRGESEHAAYALSKGAVHLFGRSIAVELAGRGVVVNTVAPGWVKTDMSARALAGAGEAQIAATIPRGVVASPEDIAGPVLFLCSDLCCHLIGSVLSVNGGSVMA